MKIDAIAFDLDGTLIETNDAWLNGLNRTLKLYGKDEGVTMEAFIENHVGVEQTKVLSYYLDLSEREMEKAVKAFNDIFISSIDYVKLQDNVIETLEYISAKTEKRAIITNSYRKVTDSILNNLEARDLDIKKYFHTIVTRDSVKEGKPNPEIIYNTCNILGVKPENMIFVEDSTSGVKAGKNAGCYVIGFTSNTSEEKLRNAGADAIITDLIDLKERTYELSH